MFLRYHQNLRLDVHINFVLIKTRTELRYCEAIDVRKVNIGSIVRPVSKLKAGTNFKVLTDYKAGTNFKAGTSLKATSTNQKVCTEFIAGTNLKAGTTDFIETVNRWHH